MRGAERWSWKQLPGAGQVLASGDLGRGAGTHGQHVVRSRVCAGRRAGFSRCGAVMTQGLCGGAAAGAVSRSPAPQPPVAWHPSGISARQAARGRGLEDGATGDADENR